MIGSTTSRLIVLRGNSGSGKSTTARHLRSRLGRGTAIVEQDQIRRVLLWEKDHPGNAAIDLIGLNARYCLDRGFDVIVEGIMHADRYGDMLRALTAEHRGTTRHYYFDIPFEETLVRHATRSWAANVAPESMREWYEARDLLAGVEQHVFDEHQDRDAVLVRILGDLGLPADTPVDPGALSYGR
ncbi:AAA family ATPase [Kribbella sp. NPDC051770]|uniref:AAA family ATPase n=1 Tax=Kribbella sp. NPDC051770 TaxID=3155413 RepID=UPI003440FA64